MWRRRNINIQRKKETDAEKLYTGGGERGFEGLYTYRGV